MFGYEEELQEKLQKVMKRITKLEQAPDAQTIMFWTLQLQFMNMSPVTVLHQLDDLEFLDFKYCSHVKKMVNDFRDHGIVPPSRYEYKLATELALHLSGLK